LKKLVILDLDNTIYAEEDYFSKVFSILEERHRLTVGILLEGYRRIDRVKSVDILGDVLKECHLFSVDMHESLFSIYSSADFDLSLPTTSSDFLSKLRGLGCCLALLTNGVMAVQENKVRALGLKGYLDYIFYARDIKEGFEKPDSRVFERVLNTAGFEKGAAIMIGDSYINDFMGARSFGIDALWLGGKGELAIETLTESLQYIEGVDK
jgi:putative hydrolase of the HAD superfamily